ncbi:MAG: hypothetical protein K8S18_21400, partial [Desulfobacula sp.]|nr:hypothetical protein [Desulfobacula sp.]
NEARQEKLKENLRMMEFDEKYPRVNGVWGVRRVQRVVRWMYKEGWWYSGGLIFIVLSGFWLRIWNLGRLGFHGDEFFHQLAADGIKETLLPVLPNGLLYFRGTFTSYLSALGSSMFNNEFGYRIYPTIFSFILMLYSFILTRRYFTKQVSYLYLVLVSSDLWIVEFSRYLRFYGTIIFLFVIITLLLIDENLLNNSKKKIALVGFLVLSAFESVVFFIFLPLILLRIWISDAHIVKKFQYAIIFLFPFVLRYYANISNKSLATIPVSNTQQFDILVKILDAINTNINYNFDPFFIKAIYFAYPFPTIIVFMGLIFIIFNFKSISKDKKLIYSIFLVLLMEFTILQAKHQQRIISPLLGLFFIAFAINISNILQAIKTCKLSKYLFFFIIILSVSSLIVPSFNIPLREYGSPFHEIKLLSSAEPYYPDYKTISNFVIDNANPNDLILISGPSPVVYWKYMSLKDKNNVDGIQTYRPGTKIINDKYYDIYTDMLIYDSISDITSIIENYEKGDVYIIFSYSSSPVNSLILDEMDTWSHLNKDLRSYIIKHSELVYVGKDNTSKVYLFAGNEIK